MFVEGHRGDPALEAYVVWATTAPQSEGRIRPSAVRPLVGPYYAGDLRCPPALDRDEATGDSQEGVVHSIR